MKFKLKDIDSKWKVYALAGCVCVLCFVVLTQLGTIFGALGELLSILQPVIIGLVMAYIINPIAVFFKNKVFKNLKKEKTQWSLSVLVAIIIVLAIIALLLVLLVPQIVENIVSIAENYQTYIDSLTNYIENSSSPIAGILRSANVLNLLSAEGGALDSIGDFLVNNARVIIEKTTSFGSTAFNWFIGAIFAFYFLSAKNDILKEIAKAFKLMLSPLKFEKGKILFAKFNAIFSKYIICELLDAAIVGVANYIFMLVCKMPNAVFVSFVVGLTNLAPTFGPIIGLVLGSFILLLVKPAAIIPFVIFTMVLQTVDGYVIKPNLFGDALNVPGVLILIAIIIFGKLMGVTGLLLAIPIAAIVVYIYSEAFIPWLELRKDLKAYRKEEAQAKKE